MDIDEQKKAARKSARQRRDAAHALEPEAAARAAAERFLASIPVAPGDTVSGYWPIRSELDPRPLMQALHEKGVPLCLPVVVGPAPLAFRAWTPGDALVPGVFGAPIPEIDISREPTVLITPLLAFTRAGARLGYGGGHYDRTLAQLRARRSTRAVAFAYAAQEVETLPLEPTDQPLDAIVTEREAILLSVG